MLNFRNNSDTLIVVLHEIYGINDHITKTCQELADSGYDVVCPDLLDGKPFFDYAREEDAFQPSAPHSGRVFSALPHLRQVLWQPFWLLQEG